MVEPQENPLFGNWAKYPNGRGLSRVGRGGETQQIKRGDEERRAGARDRRNAGYATIRSAPKVQDIEGAFAATHVGALPLLVDENVVSISANRRRGNDGSILH